MIAVKLRIRDLVEGTFDGTCVQTRFGDVSEVRILGTLIDIFASDDGSYMSLTVDDGTETVRIKAWRQDVEKLKTVSRGDFVDVVGKVREYNEEIYLTPDIISRASPMKWILRELELMKLHLQSGLEASHPHISGDAVQKESEDFVTADKVEPLPPSEIQPVLEKGESELRELESREEGKADLGEVEEFEILGEDEVVETVLDLLQEEMTKEDLIEHSGLDEIDVELALRELLDENRIGKEGTKYKRTGK